MEVLVKNIKNIAGRLLHEEDGATLVEYVMTTAFIAVVGIVSMKFLGLTASNRLNNVGTTIS